MILFDCPSCGNSYELNGERLPVNAKMYCASCGKKLINLEDGLAVIAYEVADEGAEHDVACPTCYSQFGFAKDCSGLFGCTVCGKNFYVTADLPPLPEDVVYDDEELEDPAAPVSAPAAEETSPVYAEEPAAPVSAPEAEETSPVYAEDPAAPVSAPEAEETSPVYAEDPAAPEYTGGNPLLAFKNEAKSLVSEMKGTVYNPKLKVGTKREKSGITGVFISVAEKLCRN